MRVLFPDHRHAVTKAQRPRRAVLDNRRLRERGLDTLSSWQDALRAFIAAETRSAD